MSKKIYSIIGVLCIFWLLIGSGFLGFSLFQSKESLKEKDAIIIELENKKPEIKTEYVEIIKEVIKEVNINPESFDLDEIDYTDVYDLYEKYKDKNEIIEAAIEVLKRDYSEEHPILVWMAEEFLKDNEVIEQCEDVISKNVESLKQSGDAAATIWCIFKSYGWSDTVCAGVLGNIMAEVGGQSFDVAYWLDVNGYYGMCMWNKGYNPEVVGKDLQGQCEYLRDTLKPQFDSFGYLSGYSYDDFMNLTDCSEAAVVFAKVYERCTTSSYGIRQTNAVAAYDKFA